MPEIIHSKSSRHVVWNAGVSIIELVSYIAIASIILIGISLLLGTSIGANRFQFEQVLTTEDARRQLELISDILRSARNENGNNWLVAAEDNAITVRADVDNDDVVEQVRYFLEGDDLKRGVTEVGETEKVRVVARSIRNQLSGESLFQYYNAEGQLILASEATSSTVERVVFRLHVNTSEQQQPGVGNILTEVKPRAEDTRTVRLWPITLNFPADPLSLNSGEGTVDVITTNPDTGTQTTETITFTDLNDGRVGTYTGDYYVNANYQSTTEGSDLPGWYVWVGPITVGFQGGSTLQQTDKFTHPEICFGSDLKTLLENCPTRTAQVSGFMKKYFPILTYTQLGGEVDYVRDIAYTGGTGQVCDNDTICEAGENYTNCLNDCPAPSACDNDTICDAEETNASCPADCPVAADCDNDNICEVGENFSSCPHDCTAPQCGDSICDTGEETSCPGDCSAGNPPTIIDLNINGVQECVVWSFCYPIDKTISWTVSGADQCTPSWRSGVLTLPFASETVSVEMNTTFTITCTNVFGSIQGSVTISGDLFEPGCDCL